MHMFRSITNSIIPHFMVNKKLDRDLKHIFYGVTIYWSPYGTGKTTNLKNLATSTENVFYLNAHDDDYQRKIKRLRGKKGDKLIIIDDYDVNHNNNVHNNSYACSLAEESVNEKNNRYMIGVHNPLIAKSIRRFNGGAKFCLLGYGSYYIWDDIMIKEYINSRIDFLTNHNLTIDKICFEQPIQNRIFELGSKAKNPSFINYLIDIYVHPNECSSNLHTVIFNREFDIFAEMYHNTWITGMNHLDNVWSA